MKKNKNIIQRRDFIKASALTMAATGFSSFIPMETKASSEIVNEKKNKFKVIDYRCRPPLK